MKVRAPGLLITTIARKAESAGGAMEDFSTRTTRLSQYCHQADSYVKKPLSQRWHVFPDGTRVQRDLYSAWLARFVRQNTLDTGQVCETWPAADQLLRRAGSRFMQSASVSRSSGDHGQSVGVDRPPKSLERGDGAASAPSSSGARSTRAHRGRDHARRTGGLHPVREGREKATPARDKGTSGLQAGE